MAKRKKKTTSRRKRGAAAARGYAQHVIDHFHAWEEQLFSMRDRDRDEWLAKEEQCEAT